MLKKFSDTILRDKGGNDFEGTVLKGLESIEENAQAQATKTETLLKNYEQLDKTTKTLMEELTKVKNVANDQQANADKFLKTLNALDAQLKRESRMAFGDPVRRIQADEEMRTRLNIAIRMACLRGQERIPNALADRYKAVVGKALGEDTSPGSTLIDDRLANEIYDTLATFGVWNTFGVRRLSTKQTKYPVKTARALATFILTEGGAISDDSTKAGTSVTLEVEVIAVLLLVAMQLIEDADADVTQDVLSDFAEAYANKLDHACLTAAGAGNATDGGMTGVLSGWTAAAAAAGNSTTEGTELADWIRVLTTVDPIVLARMAKWWIHPQHLVRALAVQDKNGRPIFLTALEAPSAGNIGSILGYPVVPAYILPTTNAAASKVAAFGDPNGQVCGIRRDFAFQSSDDFKFDTLQRAFRGWGRGGTKIRAATAGAYLQLTA